MAARLLFVYKAQSQLSHRALDWAHKLVSPQTYRCSLCKLTYGNFRMHPEWKKFLETLKAQPEFLYEDEWLRSDLYLPSSLPVILFQNQPGTTPEILLSSEDLENIKNLNALMERLKSNLTFAGFDRK